MEKEPNGDFKIKNKKNVKKKILITWLKRVNEIK